MSSGRRTLFAGSSAISPREFGVYPRTSAVDLLDHLAVLKGFTEAKPRLEMVDRLLRVTNLWGRAQAQAHHVLGWHAQRFGIAQALIGDPRLVIVDEPTAGLDPEERSRFLGLLSEIGEDVVVVLSTHIVDDVSDVCQGMAILADGQVRLQGDPRAVLDTLRGSVWTKAVSREELEAFRRDHAVLGTRWHAGRLVVHVLSPSAPKAAFEPVPPDLQDLYFSTLRESAPGPRMFRQIVRFELRYQLRQPLLWATAAIFAALALVAASTDGLEIGGPIGALHRNAPFVVVRMLGA